MRELIEAVKAEAEKMYKDATDADIYHHTELRDNERKRAHALARIDDCNAALTALDNAARHLTGASHEHR